MLKRIIDQKILDWYVDPNKKPLIINGMRQVGKTTSVTAFLEANADNNYVILNMLQEADREIFQNSLSYQDIIENIENTKGIIINNKTIIFIDEVQEVEKAYIFIKLTADNKKVSNNLICSGSYIDQEVYRQKYKIIHKSYTNITMYPLTFYEYALNKGLEKQLESVRKSLLTNRPLLKVVHEKLLETLNEYLLLGGMPEVISVFLSTKNLNTVQTILARLSEQQKSDIIRDLNERDSYKVLKIYDNVFESMRKNEGLEISKLKLADLGGNARFSSYKKSLDIIVRSNILTPIYQNENNIAISKNNYRNIKLVYSDLGFVTLQLGLLRTESIINKKQNNEADKLGYITENFVALELKAYNVVQDLHYWFQPRKKVLIDGKEIIRNSKEIEFLVNGNPIDVKANTNLNRSASMKLFCNTYNYDYSIIISRRQFNIDKKTKNIKLPLYAIWLYQDIIKTYR